MAKASEDAAVAELPLNDDRKQEKKGRHVTIALNHLNKQRFKVLAQYDRLSKEIEELNEAIAALE